MDTVDTSTQEIPKQDIEFALALSQAAKQDSVTEVSKKIAQIPLDEVQPLSEKSVEAIDKMIDQARTSSAESTEQVDEELKVEQEFSWIECEVVDEYQTANTRTRDSLNTCKAYLSATNLSKLQLELSNLEAQAKELRKTLVKHWKEDTPVENQPSECQVALQQLQGLTKGYKELQDKVHETRLKDEQVLRDALAKLEQNWARMDAERISAANLRVRVEGPHKDEKEWSNTSQDIQKSLKSEQVNPSGPYEPVKKRLTEISNQLTTLFKEITSKQREARTEANSQIEAIQKEGDEKVEQLKLEQANWEKQKTELQLRMDELSKQCRQLGMKGDLTDGAADFYDKNPKLPNAAKLKQIALEWSTAKKDRKEAIDQHEKLTKEVATAITDCENAVTSKENTLFPEHTAYETAYKSAVATRTKLQNQAEDLTTRKLLAKPLADLNLPLTSIEEIRKSRDYLAADKQLKQLQDLLQPEAQRLQEVEADWQKRAKEASDKAEALKDPAGLKLVPEDQQKIAQLRQEIKSALKAEKLEGDTVTNAIDVKLPELSSAITTATQKIRKNAENKFAGKVGKNGLIKDEESLKLLLDNFDKSLPADAPDLINSLTAEQLVGIYGEFGMDAEEGQEKLAKLIKEGLGSTTDLTNLLKDGCQGDAKKLKSLNDAFDGNLDSLKLINAQLGSETGKTLAKLRDQNYGGDAKKLKTKFFDNLKTQADKKSTALSDAQKMPTTTSEETEKRDFAIAAANNRKSLEELIKLAPKFVKKALPTDLPEPDSPHGCDVNMKHFCKRHLQEYFNFDAEALADEGETLASKRKTTTFWPEGTTPETLAEKLSDALDLMGDNFPNVTEIRNNSFKAYWVPPPKSSAIAKIGFEYKTNIGKVVITQFYPASGVRIEFEDMHAIKKAIV